MTPNDRHLLASLAVRLLEASPRRRDELIAAALTERPDLRAQVADLARSMTAPASASGDPIDDLAELFELAAGATTQDPPDLSGTTIGRYRLVRRLGVGAYGAVYSARRVRGAPGRLALKLLHPGVSTPSSVRRFVREQRVLASCDHPGVARLLAAGSAPNGCPYFVMERIDGPSLRGHCRTHAPPLPDRLILMVHVCEAVQHVHGKGIVHRDLKPGNILVRTVDGQPRPIVIDFGVVRLLDVGPDSASTTQGRLMGTRRYMSPEQRCGGTVDARSDIYALGVVMAEILSMPFGGSSSEQTGPSPAPSPRRDARPRAPRLAELVEELPLASRSVVERCTRAHPDDRYPAIAELIEDLRRLVAMEGGPPSRSQDATSRSGAHGSR